MGTPIILLGAGASIDAGLPDTYDLTRLVYEKMGQPSYGRQRLLFGYVIAKLLTRKVRSGGSPFAQINIEDAYDAVSRLLNRDADMMSDFVYSWDPILEQLKEPFNEENFAKHITEALIDQTRGGLDRTGILSVKSGPLHRAAQEISQSLSGNLSSDNAPRILQNYLNALIECLLEPATDTKYIDQLVDFVKESAAVIGSLNYDLLVEDAAERSGQSIDYGLSHWNQRKVVRWTGTGLKMMKLHGSINWCGDYDNIEIVAPDTRSYYGPRSIMVFGGHAGKLIPHGPFLQLRHYFERALLSTNKLLIIGYSFRDDHLNALIRRWVSTRQRAKLGIVNPQFEGRGVDLGAYHRRVKGQKELKFAVEVWIFRAGAKDALNEAIKFMKSAPRSQAPYLWTTGKPEE